MHPLSISSVLYPVSPSLAALHATRHRLTTQQPASTLHCPRCGSAPMTFRTHRVPPASIQRGKSQKAIRVMRRTCDACGHLSDQSFPAPNAILFRKVSLAPYGKPPSPPTQLHSASDTPMASASTPSSTDVHIHLPRLTQSVPIIPPTSPHPTTPTVPSSSTSKRSKKKSGLQELLARKRDQEQRRGDSEGNGLAAFLNGL